MSIHAALNHRTSYRYERPVALGPQIVRLRPAPHARTEVLSYSLNVTPKTHFINWQQDPFGNWMARLVFPEKTDHFEIEIDLVADMAAINPFDFFLEGEAEHVPFGYDEQTSKELAPYLEKIEGGARLDALVAEMDARMRKTKEYRTVDFLVDCNRAVQSRVNYTIRMEPGVQTPEETLEKALGSCRDSGWLLVALMRRLGYAARFVSGYLIQFTADQAPIDGGPSGPAEDFTDLHAWTEIYAPGAGWIGLDPTSGLFAGEGHIPLAATPSPQSAAPISGAVEAAKVEFDFSMSVSRLRETPRVTKPVEDEAWDRVMAAGRAVDAKLRAGDVRLTMGGEPTFVAAFDRDADEWNTAAVGPTKRAYADQLIRGLRGRFARGGLLHYGQGKWYPGEQLPRWAFSLIWRKDGQPLWGDPDLIAAETPPGGPKQRLDPALAGRFTQRLAEALEIDPAFAAPAFEDPAEFMLRERKLAPNLDPIDNKIDDVEERTRLARVFDRGLETPAGWVLPIQAAQAAAYDVAQREILAGRKRRRFRWASERWRTRRGRLFLIPGDSPAGFRLPLRALAFIDEANYPHHYERDPFAPREPLPQRSPSLQRRGFDVVAPAAPPAFGPMAQQPGLAGLDADDPELLPILETTDWLPMEDVVPGGAFFGSPVVRTAITVEPRMGPNGETLCVFLPPTSSADQYVDLIQAIEETAAAVGQPVHVEGYPPPMDPRLELIKVTPDPGVIEVNVHPAASWDEQVAATEALYDEARAVGLEASKFLPDGRPTGSGGGAHAVVGGAAPEHSPFLRRPDLLGSLVRYWQNHPSLSYLFAGMFVGPTSQAPRVDEARHDSLYELEIALAQIPDPFRANGSDCPPWLVDRLLRNLLVDVTGNTHRAEICIDKLYSPDGPAGRLGLVEFRAFEMPPHARMNLAQALILRGLIALFWEKPYTKPFIRFGTRLHDQYLLPDPIWADFETVLAELSAGLGVAFEPDWFKAQFEFRFPNYGSVRADGIEIGLRAGIEPWHVLGEEGAVGGTTRFVDSSVERLQVSVSGDLGSRYAVACNGWRLPLQRTDQADRQIAGVRFRTWLPASCLHPTIFPHGPLVFDLVDSWNGRAVGGCTYHVEHPGGRNTDLQPVNSLEAESRRLARFDAFGHTPGPFRLFEPKLSPEFPTTLDLRMQHVR
ncbi:MAG: transglutaminase family protein [Pseudomonadota bacterium]